MSDEFLPVTGFDASQTDSDVWVLDQIDLVLQDAIASKSAKKAFNSGNGLIKIAKASGKGLMKLLYGLRENWGKFSDVDGSFEDTAYVELGLHKLTVERYVNTWEILFVQKVIPDQFDNINNRSVKDLIPIADVLSRGYSIKSTEWKELERAPNYTEVKRILRAVTGKSATKRATTLILEQDGTIRVYNEGTMKVVGWLNVNDEDDEIVAKMITRIVNSAGILRK